MVHSDPYLTFHEETEVIVEIISFIDYVSHFSDLQHDQDRINHFLIHISLEHIPSLTEAVEELRAFGAAGIIQENVDQTWYFGIG